MGNRYTVTTLTGRELQTVMACHIKLQTIMFRRNPMHKPNEAVGPWNTLFDAVENLALLIDQVDEVRSEQDA